MFWKGRWMNQPVTLGREKQWQGFSASLERKKLGSTGNPDGAVPPIQSGIRFFRDSSNIATDPRWGLWQVGDLGLCVPDPVTVSIMLLPGLPLERLETCLETCLVTASP